MQTTAEKCLKRKETHLLKIQRKSLAKRLLQQYTPAHRKNRLSLRHDKNSHNIFHKTGH
jgi:hypothetical protein